jgi:hypothetical protein
LIDSIYNCGHRFLLCRLGAIADLQLALQKGAGSGNGSANVIVVAGDTLFLEVFNKPHICEQSTAAIPLLLLSTEKSDYPATICLFLYVL